MNTQTSCPAAKPGNRDGRGRGPRPARLRRARAAAVITVMTATALLAAACGGSPSSAGTGPLGAGGSAGSSSGVAYSRCVRSHGVPNFPDPGGDGQLSKAAEVRALREVGDSVAKAATAACANLNPAGQAPSTVTAAEQRYYLRAAACMRSHGITGFPDPTFPGGHPTLPTPPASIDTSSRQYIQAAQICKKLIPAGLPDSGNSGSGG